jgi:hypothetical protein
MVRLRESVGRGQTRDLPSGRTPSAETGKRNRRRGERHHRGQRAGSRDLPNVSFGRFDYFTPEAGSPDGKIPKASSQRGCVFVGALDYKPNIDGIIWFARNVWPQIHRQHPDQTLSIVGREPVADVRKLAGIPGVDVVGTVPDVRPYLSQAAVAVVPLRIARGVQNKVLEALAKAVVASPDPLVGLRVEDGVQIFKAVEAEQWVSCVSRLLDDAQLRHDVGVAGQAYVTAHHRWEQCLEPLMRFLHLENRETSNVALAADEQLLPGREIK